MLAVVRELGPLETWQEVQDCQLDVVVLEWMRPEAARTGGAVSGWGAAADAVGGAGTSRRRATTVSPEVAWASIKTVLQLMKVWGFKLFSLILVLASEEGSEIILGSCLVKAFLKQYAELIRPTPDYLSLWHMSPTIWPHAFLNQTNLTISGTGSEGGHTLGPDSELGRPAPRWWQQRRSSLTGGGRYRPELP